MEWADGLLGSGIGVFGILECCRQADSEAQCWGSGGPFNPKG
jgi:hypothetical protein